MRLRAAHEGFTLIELMIVIVIIAILAAISIPALLATQRSGHEQSTAATLRTLAPASMDFRTNDRDQNLVNDFWTKDVAGLYTIYPASTPNSPIKLIDPAVAGADATPGGGTPFSTPRYAALDITALATRSHKSGHWFFALDSDLSGGAAVDYQQPTDDQPANLHHNMSGYAFGAYPDSIGFGKYLFVMNETAVVYRRDLVGNVRPTGAAPPGYPLASGAVGGSASDPKDWPTDENLRRYYKKID